MLLVVLAIWLLSMERYQNMLIKRVARFMSEKLHTKVEIAHVKFSFFNHFNLDGVYIEDTHQDTLAYIGRLQIRSTDLLSAYWNDKTPVIKDLALEQGFVYMNRKDSVWNYDFLQTAFGSSDKDTIQKDLPEKKGQSSDRSLLDLKLLRLKNIKFYMDDGWVGRDMRFAVGELLLDVDQFDLAHWNVAINKLDLQGANILVKEYTGAEPDDTTATDTTQWGTPFNPANLALSLKQLKIANSAFVYQRGMPETQAGEFDHRNLQCNNINLEVSDAKVVADTLFADIRKFQVAERCGLNIKDLHGKLKLSQVQAQLSQMQLQTDHSLIQDHYEMRYRNFHDFSRYITHVTMIARLQQSKVSSIDIAYFAKALKQYPIAIDLSGEAKGTVDHLQLQQLNIATRNTVFAGDVLIDGLPDIRQTIFTAAVKNFVSSGTDLNALIPQTSVNAIAWNELRHISFSGTYQGKVDDFHTKGNLRTTLGDAYVDLDLNLQPKIPVYAGEINTSNFYLGKLIKQAGIGHLSMNGKINGSGFDLNSLNTKLNATVDRIEIDKNVYHNLTINGIVSNRKFDGIFVSLDSNLAFNFNGVLDISGKIPSLNFNTRILRFDLKKFGLTEESTVVSCLASLHFTGNNIDNFLGQASLRNVTLQTRDRQIHIDSVYLSSTDDAKEKLIQLKSSVADAEIKGRFNISELSNALQLYLCHYLPHYIKRPDKQINEQFVYTVNIKEASALLDVFMPKLKNIDGTQFSGALNTYEKKFSMDAYFPGVTYDNMRVSEMYVVSAGDFSSFDMNVNSKDFFYNDESIIPSFQINTTMARDTAVLEINTQSINDLLGNASIKVKGTAMNNQLFIDILPSSISIKQDKWHLYSNHEMIIGDEIVVKDFIVESGAQKITLNTEKNATNDLIAKFVNIDLESVSLYAGLTEQNYFGRISGDLVVSDFMHHPFVQAKATSVNDVRINKDTVGMVSLDVSYDLEKKLLNIDKSTSINRNGDRAFVSGTINLKDSSINVKASMNNTEISFVNQFIDDYVENLHGKITGNVLVQGKLSDPFINGNANLKDASLKVVLLGTTYRINDAKLRFNNQKIEMDDMEVFDERQGNYAGTVKGFITHKSFTDFNLNLRLQSEDLLCLNTNEWNSDLFYGYVRAKVNMQIKGELDDLSMDINARPLPGSAFYLPLGGTGDASKFEFVKFIEIGHKQNDEELKKNNYLKLTMNIEATPDIETIIVMDKNTGEEIRARGNGDLKLIVDLGNAMEMYGNYVITEGKYLFKFRGVVNREFKIDEGSEISWSGDALGANLNVNATYEVPKQLALYPLVSNVQLDDADKLEAKRTYKTLVPLTLRGSLSQPDIKFDILQPDNKSVGSAGYTKLQQIKTDEKELFNQAGVLLLLGDFKASEGVSQATYSQGAVSTVSDLVGTAVSSEITNQFQNLTGLKNISLNLGYQSLSNQADLSNPNRNQFSLNVSANLLKDRVVVDFGNSVDVGKDATGNTTSNFNGDFKAQFLITNDGRLRANAYRTNNVDIGGSPYTRGGVGLSYKKVFNSFSDLLSAKK